MANQSGVIDVTFDSPSGTIGGNSKLTTSIVLKGRRGFGLNVQDVSTGNSNFAEITPGDGRIDNMLNNVGRLCRDQDSRADYL